MLKKSPENPIILPSPENPWESEAAFNPSTVLDGGKTHVVYRAVSGKQKIGGNELEVSSIGYAVSSDGIHFKHKRQLIKPEYDWEKYGCEDPRITKIGGKYYIFYTALSDYPFRAEGIRAAVAITRNFESIEEKHLVTPFNAKAMSLFPSKVGRKFAAILSVNTDRPPARICLALFDRIEDAWSKEYWERWYNSLDEHVIKLQKSSSNQVEAGSPAIKTKHGWLVVYSQIENYFTLNPVFTVCAALLDLKNPLKMIGRTERTLLLPEEEYEKFGKTPNIVFPTGTTVKNGYLSVYYGASDTTCAVARGKLSDIVDEIVGSAKIKLKRYKSNPILQKIPEHGWEAKAVFNPAAVYEDRKIHLVYRAMSDDNTSTFGYAASKNGFEFGERLENPIYIPREDFEKKSVPLGNSGCEDPRVTKIGDTFYMCYTVYDGKNPPRVALTSIKVSDFLSHRWNWAKPILTSPPGMDDKDAALFPKKIDNRYVLLHRIGADIWIDFVDDLSFPDREKGRWLGGRVLMSPRQHRWDSKKIGIAAPPIETKYGWMLLYHGISKDGVYYRVKAALLDLKNPRKVLARTNGAILEPEADYEKEGEVRNVVFPCGAVVFKKNLLVYYGGGDKVVGVASIEFKKLLAELLREAKKGAR